MTALLAGRGKIVVLYDRGGIVDRNERLGRDFTLDSRVEFETPAAGALENVQGLCANVRLLGCVRVRSLVKVGETLKVQAGTFTSQTPSKPIQARATPVTPLRRAPERLRGRFKPPACSICSSSILPTGYTAWTPGRSRSFATSFSAARTVSPFHSSRKRRSLRYRIPRRPDDRIKPDRRDAAPLAVLYRAGALTAIHVPTDQEERMGSLALPRNIRADLLRARTSHLQIPAAAWPALHRDEQHVVATASRVAARPDLAPAGARAHTRGLSAGGGRSRRRAARG